MAHQDQTELLKDLENLYQKVKLGDKYFHYKHPDQFYNIVALGFIEETEIPCVIYQFEYCDRITWVRPQNDFFAKVTLENGSVVDRFTKVS